MLRITLAASLIALAAACSQPQEPAAETTPIQLYAMDCGRIDTVDAGIFADDNSADGQARGLIDPCYLIRHPSGDLLWDAGLPEAIADSPEGVTEAPFHLTVPVKLTAQLQQLGLTPADIEFISFSHSHFDHVGNGALFTSATWIVDADERAYMFRDEARADARTFPMIAPLENFQTQLIEGDADHDVFGDGAVTIIQAPGHTPGHTILRVNLASGPVLLTGDMWHLAESRELRRVPEFNSDRAQTLASMDKIEALAAETNARVVMQHVPEDFAALPAFPQPLE